MSTVRRNKKELDVEQLEADLDSFDPSTAEAIDATPLRDLFALVRSRELLDNQVTATIAAARSAGISWGYIAEALGVSRQAARQKYDSLIEGLEWAPIEDAEWPWPTVDEGLVDGCVLLFHLDGDSKKFLLRYSADKGRDAIVKGHRFFGGGSFASGGSLVRSRHGDDK